LEIACLAGLVWVTDGVRGDRVVQSGQQITVCSNGKVCVQAFTPSVVRVRPLAPAADAGWQHGQGDVREVLAKS
jgi:hypothetical protein